ncbi:MAG: hypothetical protein FJX71_02960 [Alphaproteobacteria bacterium]|nr:hypothetical protein [Alphaproteobacteria bacterium]
MKLLGWLFRVIIIAFGVCLFVLQSQPAKKSLLEFIINQPLKNSPFRFEAHEIRGLFPFQFSVASLNLKKDDQQLAMIPDIYVSWSLPSLLSQDVRVNLLKGRDLAGELTYNFSQQSLKAHMSGKGLPLKNDLVLTSVTVDLSELTLVKGRLVLVAQDQQEETTLSLNFVETETDKFNVENVRLEGRGIKGSGFGKINAREDAGEEVWEGKMTLSIADLASYQKWVSKDISGSAQINCQKTSQGPAEIDLQIDNFKYDHVLAKSVHVHANGENVDVFKLKLQGLDAQVNGLLFAHLSLDGAYEKGKGTFDLTGMGEKDISLKLNGSVDKTTPDFSEVQINLKQAELNHPLHHFSLKEPTQLIWGQDDIRASKIWLTSGDGMMTLQNFRMGENLTGDILIERLPLKLLRITNPDLEAEGYLTGKGHLKGTKEKPEAELSLEGKSLQLEGFEKARKGLTDQSLKTDFSSQFKLINGFIEWTIKVMSGRFLVMTSQGKISAEDGLPTLSSTVDATIKGQGEMEIISLFIPYGDLIQGQANLDFAIKGNLKAPVIQGRVSVVNGVYENAQFGTYIKNIRIQGNASGDTLTLTSITGQDNSKGHVTGHSTVKFTSLFNPLIDLQLNMTHLLVVQNDEITGKANGHLRLHGHIIEEPKYPKAKITGDVILDPIEVRLDERLDDIVTIKIREKNKGPISQVRAQTPLQSEKEASYLPLDIHLNSPGKIYLHGQGFDAQWKGEMRAVGDITDPHLVGSIDLVKGKFDISGKPLKLTEGRITYSDEPKNDPLITIIGTRELGEITAIMRIEGRASDPKIVFSSSPALPQEEVLARLLFGRGVENMSVTQSLLLANALSSFKGKNNLNFTDKIRAAFGLDVLEFKERKSPDADEFESAGQQVSVGKQISDRVYLSLDQSVSGEGGTTATVQLDVTPSFKIEADVGGDKNTAVGFAWVKKY